MVSQQCQPLSTGLKPGVNETTFGVSPRHVLGSLLSKSCLLSRTAERGSNIVGTCDQFVGLLHAEFVARLCLTFIDEVAQSGAGRRSVSGGNSCVRRLESSEQFSFVGAAKMRTLFS